MRPSLGEIQLGPERVHIEPRSMQVLLALAANPSKVIPKQELIEAVWGDAFVSDEVLTHAIWDLRRAFGDNASDPEFIQTIPKRGYRLIAPVKPTEPMRRRATDRETEAGKRAHLRRTALAVLTVLVLLSVVTALIVWPNRSVEPDVVAPSATKEALLLLPTRTPVGYEGWGPRLDRRLLDGLAGLERMVLRQQEECGVDTVAQRTFCLEPILLSITDGAELSVSLREASSTREVYASPVSPVAGSAELDAAARELTDLVGSYFDVLHDPWSRDPDLRPWFNLNRHDPRAVRDFLRGVRYVYRFDSGGADAMELAMATDPNFIAPRVWRSPTIAGAGEEAREAHRRELERLYGRGDSFEKAMIMWAQAVLDNDFAAQLRQLDVALGHQPGNRPAINARGVAHLLQAEFEEAWIDFERLLRARWDYPGLYPTTAYTAVRLDRLKDVRAALAPALEFEVVDVNSLALLRLLAIFDGDTDGEAELGARLGTRRKEQPDGLDTDTVRFVAEYLASKAEARGRHDLAARLRESAI